MKSLIIKIGFCLITLGISTIQAQEFSGVINTGIQGLDFKVNNGGNELKIGSKIGVGYTYFLNQHWGIVTGAELGYFKNHSTLDDRTYSSYQIDSEGEAFDYRVKTKGYKEESHFYSASIPLMLQYRTLGNTQFYINGGGRVYFPFAQQTKVGIDELKMSGYYADLNVELVDIPSHGFGTLTNWKSESETKLKTTFSLSAETGVSFKISDKIRLYTGLYIDYGLSNLQNKNQLQTDVPLVNYNAENNAENQPNGIIQTSNAIDRAKLLAYGFQVRIGFGRDKQKEIMVSELQIETIPVVEEMHPEIIVEKESELIQQKKLITSQQELVEEPIVFNRLDNQ